MYFITTKLYSTLFDIECCLVGGFNPSEKYESQLGWLFPIYVYEKIKIKIKAMFQTTNQKRYSTRQYSILNVIEWLFWILEALILPVLWSRSSIPKIPSKFLRCLSACRPIASVILIQLWSLSMCVGEYVVKIWWICGEYLVNIWWIYGEYGEYMWTWSSYARHHWSSASPKSALSDEINHQNQNIPVTDITTTTIISSTSTTSSSSSSSSSSSFSSASP